MKIPELEVERWKMDHITPKTLNLTETGVPEAMELREIFSDALLELRMEYAPAEGLEKLRQEISELYSGADIDNVLVTTSATEANMIGVNLAVNSGDEVLVIQPSYMQIPGLIEASGVRIRELQLEEESMFDFDIDKFNELMTDNVKVVALNYPNSPTGRVLSREKVKAISEIANDHKAWIICDETHRGLEFQGPLSPSFSEFCKKSIVSSSLSKTWGLPGLRVGWAIAPKDVVRRGVAFKQYTSLRGSVFAETVALIVLEKGMRQNMIERARRSVLKNFRVFEKWIDGHKDIFTWFRPEFGAMTLVKHSFSVGSEEFAEKILRDKGVAIIPCDKCMPSLNDASHFLWMGYSLPTPRLLEALKKVDEFIEETVVAP